MLHPGARVLWRHAGTIQIELGQRAIVLDGVDEHAVRALTARPAAPAPAPAGTPTTSRPSAQPVLDTLARAGFVWPRAGLDQDDARLAAPLPRLAAELGALSTARGEIGAELLNARRHYCVTVQGTSQLAAHVGAVLAAAGIGRVCPLDHGRVSLHQAMPGGLAPDDEGQRFAAAATRAITRSAPETDTALPGPDDRPDLVILAQDDPVDPERRDALHRRGWAHLVVRVAADHAIVGPLVIPGLSSCLRCADLHRADRDPAWPALAVQLSARRRRGAPANVALATVIGGIAALQALAFLDGAEPATLNGTLEMYLPDWRIRRRSWPSHPECDCGR
jgi:hypothetical protein